jgi:hypothetical protein
LKEQPVQPSTMSMGKKAAGHAALVLLPQKGAVFRHDPAVFD